MGTPIVFPGDKIRLSADFMNRTARKANAPTDRTGGEKFGPLRPGEIWIKNNTGIFQKEGNILGIESGTIPTPILSSETYGLTGVVPVAESFSRFVILLENLEDGTYGRAMVAGTIKTVVKWDGAESVSDKADILVGSTEMLTFAGSGSAVVLGITEEGDPGTRVIYVQLTGISATPITLWRATSAESGGYVTARRMNSDGTVTGSTMTFPVLPE